MHPEQLDERGVEPDAVHVTADERCGNGEERNQVFGGEAAMLHLVEVAFDDESLEDDSDEAFNAVVGAKGRLWTNVLTMQISDVLKLNRTRTHLLHHRVGRQWSKSRS